MSKNVNLSLCSKVEVGQLKDRLSQSSAALSTAGASGSEANLRLELTSSQVGAAHIRSELDRARKDKQITSGLVTQLQRDMANKVGFGLRFSFSSWRIGLRT